MALRRIALTLIKNPLPVFFHTPELLNCKWLAGLWGQKTRPPLFRSKWALRWMDRGTENTQGEKPRFTFPWILLLKITLLRYTWHTKMHIFVIVQCGVSPYLYTPDQDKYSLSPSPRFPYALNHSFTPLFSLPVSRQPLVCFLQLQTSLHFLEFYISRIIQYTFFVFLFLLSVIVPWFILVCIKIPFLFIAE